MLKKLFPLLVLASIPSLVQIHAGNYADSVITYSSGTGFATEFGTGIGFTNAASALGEPSRTTPGQFGGPVDPFNPPYLKEQLVSIGAGGSLTLGFSSPILNNPNNPFGLDLIVFGNAGFIITNGDFTGGGITDGTLFGANSGATRVWVSSDNATYYQLDPTRAPNVDTLFPTDGSGNFDRPVNSALVSGDFAGTGLSGIRSRYNGSGGGAGFDIGWAEDSHGNPVVLPEVRFIRIDVLSGAAEVDGISAIAAVPELPPGRLLALGLVLLFGMRNFLGKERVHPAPIHGSHSVEQS